MIQADDGGKVFVYNSVSNTDRAKIDNEKYMAQLMQETVLHAKRNQLSTDLIVGAPFIGPTYEKLVKTPEFQVWSAKTYDLLAQRLHELSGGAVTPQEAERLVRTMPVPADKNFGIYEAKADSYIKQRMGARRAQLQSLKKTGYDVRGF